MNTFNAQAYLDLKDHKLFQQAIEDLDRESLKAIKNLLEEKAIEIKVDLHSREINGRDEPEWRMKAETARGHVVRNIKYVDSLLSKQRDQKQGFWLMWVIETEKRKVIRKGWLASTTHPVEWLAFNLAEEEKSGGDPNDIELSQFWPLSPEQFNSLPESIQRVS